MPLHEPLVLDGVIASIDSVRIKFTYSKTCYDFERNERCETLDRILCNITSEKIWLKGLFDFRVYESNFKIGNYHYTVNYRLPDDNSFSVLVGRFCFDSMVKQLAPEIILDFNPNKIQTIAWAEVLGCLIVDAELISVQRFDLALDFPVKREELELVRRPGSGYQKFISTKGAITEYIGQRSQHSAIKLYDKAAELESDIDCSRLEITIAPGRFNSLSSLFPEIISYRCYELEFDLASLPFPVQAVIIHPDLRDRLKQTVSRNTWTSYKNLLEKYDQLHNAFGSCCFTIPDEFLRQIDSYINRKIHDYSDKTGLLTVWRELCYETTT